MLNGMLHLDVLDGKFGRERVLGGLCATAVTLNDKREVVQLAPMQSLNFGERDGRLSDRVRAIAEVMASGNFGSVASEHIVQEMWEKWVFPRLARGIDQPDARLGRRYPGFPGGKDFILGIVEECSAVAAAEGHPRVRRFWSGRAAC